jgi:alkylated DNA repair dioxygenase AlkB
MANIKALKPHLTRSLFDETPTPPAAPERIAPGARLSLNQDKDEADLTAPMVITFSSGGGAST